MGTPDFAVPTLRALVGAHEVVCVYCQPPRPAGRGKAERPSPVQRVAESLGLPVRHPARLKDPADQAAFADLQADVAVVVAYGLILPRPILEAPRLGCLNVHASLLPRWRGAAPIQRAIMAGDAETGVTIMRMEAGLDTGPMLLAGSVPIGADANAGTLHDALSALGAPLLLRALAGWATGTLPATPQPTEGVTYAAKIDKAESRLDWSRAAPDVDRHVRGITPAPGAFFTHGEDRIKVLACTPVVEGRPETPPGTVLDTAPTVACGEGTALRLRVLQRAGKAPLEAEAFLRGHPLPPGTVLG
ncbi:methionyl-tRNA formyltransferase [Roseospira visakhapatnamensis]|nr:methionyl-tRNA formyltransferase [Roseospira visakhapatnamensis]